MSPINPSTPYEGREPSNADILATLTPMASRLERLENHMTGGENPEKGQIVRLDRLEQAQAAQRRWGIAALGGGGAGLLGAIKAWLMTGGTTPHT